MCDMNELSLDLAPASPAKAESRGEKSESPKTKDIFSCDPRPSLCPHASVFGSFTARPCGRNQRRLQHRGHRGNRKETEDTFPVLCLLRVLCTTNSRNVCVFFKFLLRRSKDVLVAAVPRCGLCGEIRFARRDETWHW